MNLQFFEKLLSKLLSRTKAATTTIIKDIGLIEYNIRCHIESSLY